MKWKTTNAKRIYRLGHKGKVNVYNMFTYAMHVQYAKHIHVLVYIIHIYCTWRLCKFNFVDEILHSVKFLSTINRMNVHVHVG